LIDTEDGIASADVTSGMSHPDSPPRPPGMNTQVDAVWHEHRRYLLDVAFRMLGNISDAEDVVQEAFTRLLGVDLDEIDDVRGWLVVVVSRLCLDHLRSARVRREASAGPQMAEAPLEPASPLPDPADRVTLDDS